MLVLSRMEGETIVIDGGTVRVMVVEIRGNKVRLGVAAPPCVTIHREEVQKKIDQKEKENGKTGTENDE